MSVPLNHKISEHTSKEYTGYHNCYFSITCNCVIEVLEINRVIMGWREHTLQWQKVNIFLPMPSEERCCFWKGSHSAALVVFSIMTACPPLSHN